MRCWILVDENKKGTENQCLGLAEALGLTPELYSINLIPPFGWWPSVIKRGALSISRSKQGRLAPPWPDVIITAGRRSVGAALACKHMAPKCILIALQDPKVGPHRFDWVISPSHDGVSGSNVIQTTGALNRISPHMLAQGAASFQPDLSAFPSQRIGVLIGGNARGVSFTQATAQFIAAQLKDAAKDKTLFLSTSRRTPKTVQSILRAELAHIPGYQYYGTGPNPYQAMLWAADVLVVTSDSVSMMSEGCSSGKPVYVMEVPGTRQKFQSFIQSLYAQGFARPFDSSLAVFQTPGLNEAARVAALLKPSLGL